jgi:hypothetical protein
MINGLALRKEDVMMAGYASLVGLTIIFPVLFPLKFRFTTKTILQSSSIGLILCNIIAMSTDFVPVLVAVSFIAGLLKLWGTFGCISTIQLKITPTRDFAVFLPVMFTLVLGSIQLSGIAAGYITYFFHWEYMHLFIIALHLLIVLCCRTMLRHVRTAPLQPLKGIDWLDGVLWSLFLLLVIFVLEYGELYDWLDSMYIQIALAAAAAVLGTIIWRAKTMQHPYIHLSTFQLRRVATLLILFGLMCVLLATPTILQNAYTGAILHYDSLQTVSLSWPVLFGILCGAYFSYIALVKWEFSCKRLTSIGFALIMVYLVNFYFLIAPAINKEMMYLPLFFRGAGNVIIYIALTVYAGRTTPFMFFFQVLSILGFVRTGFGAPLGNAIVSRAFSAAMKRNLISLGSEIDIQNPLLHAMPFGSAVEEVYRQVMLVTIKEIYGYAALAAFGILIISLCTRYKNILKLKMPR